MVLCVKWSPFDDAAIKMCRLRACYSVCFLVYYGIPFFGQKSHGLSRALHRSCTLLKYMALNSDTLSNCTTEGSVVSEQSLFMIITFQEGKQV